MRVVVAVLSVGLCGVVALTAQANALTVGGAVVVAQLVLAGAVYQSPDVRAPGSAWLVVASGGLLATTLAEWPDLLAGSRTSDSAELTGGTLAGVGPAVAFVVVAAMLREMLRRGRRNALTTSLATTVMLGASAVLLAAWVATAKTAEGGPVVLAAAAAAAAAAAVWSLPGPRPVIAPAAVIAGTAAGLGVHALLGDPPDLAGVAVLAAAAAVLTACGRGIAATLSVDPARRMSVEAVLPLTLVGPIAFWVGQLLV